MYLEGVAFVATVGGSGGESVRQALVGGNRMSKERKKGGEGTMGLGLWVVGVGEKAGTWGAFWNQNSG